MLTDKNKTCCFTGHRQIPSDRLSAVVGALRDAVCALYDEGYRHFIAGGALGFDTYAARAVLILKRERPDMTLSLFLPCLDQADAWSEKDKAEYERIKSEADEVLTLADRYFDGCMQKRNQAMVDASSACIAYVTRPRSGAGQTVRMAERAGLTVIHTFPQK